MKISRQKKVQRFLNFYVNNFAFRSPFQVLIDGTYCFAALKNQHDIQDNLPRYFQQELKFLTTPCIVLETEKLGDKVIGAMLIIKKFAVHKCKHLKSPVSGAACIKSMIGKDNSSRYIVASQDRELQEYLRKIPGVPLLYLHQKTPVLEHPSQQSEFFARNKLESIAKIEDTEAKRLQAIKKSAGIVEVEDEIPKKKKKKRGPNPLSCKKKKKKSNPNKDVPKVNADVIKKKKKRKRIKIPSMKIPDHVKKELLNK